jgi:adenylyltransferase/sulfurtransferase
MFDNYFLRQIDLWGIDIQKSLEDKRVAIIGAGGLGSSLGYALGSSGIGYIDIVDFDTIALHNIHRQIAYTTDDIGKSKATILADRLKQRNPFVEVRAFVMDFEEFISLDLDRYDLILDATDNIESRLKIDKFAKENNLVWIYGSVEEFMGQVCLFENSSFTAFNSTTHIAPKGITAPMVMNVASLQAIFALRFLANLAIKRDVLHYIYMSGEGELITQKFNMPK